MVRSAPRISFSVTSIDYGTIDVGDSATTQEYNIRLVKHSTVMTEALFMSISFAPVTNASEVRAESWVWISTTLTGGRVHIGSATVGPEASIGSVIAGLSNPTTQTSVHVRTNIIVPAVPNTAGAVAFNLHHRYQYTGDDDDYAYDY